jgi:hypothetical protein
VLVGDFTIDHVSGPRTDRLPGADILLAFDLDIDGAAHRLKCAAARTRCRHGAIAERRWLCNRVGNRSQLVRRSSNHPGAIDLR